MSKRFITTNTDGTMGISTMSGSDADGSKLAKTLFELSRTTDLTTHFNPEVHTLEAIAAGISGHSALALIAECEDTDLPTDRDFRNPWEWED